MTLETAVEIKRFNPSRDTIWKYKDLRSRLHDLQTAYPWLSGFSFFGSRAKGVDKYGSDFDLCIFYDSSKPNFPLATRTNWNNIIFNIWDAVQATVDHRMLECSGGLRIDLSQDRTISELDSFINTINNNIQLYGLENIFSHQLLNTLGIPPTQNLYSRFFLGIGDEVYRNRQFILDYLEKHQNGELYFQILMSCLRHFENTSKRDGVADRTIDSLPKSISEARRYFVLRKTREIFKPT